MILTVELYLKVNDETVTLLQEYGKLMRHEIYKVVGVFQKRGQVFNLPYRAVSRKLAPGARHLVMKQAKILYEKRCTNPDEKPDFSSVWPTKACRIENHFLLFRCRDSCQIRLDVLFRQAPPHNYFLCRISFYR